jgi:hypothetical protein
MHSIISLQVFERAREAPEYLDHLELLRDRDDAGRIPGTPDGTIDQALDYLRGLEQEEYLERSLYRLSNTGIREWRRRHGLWHSTNRSEGGSVRLAACAVRATA